MITITIDGVDRTNNIEFGSLQIRNILTRKRDTCVFDVITHAGQTWKPPIGKEIIVQDGATKIFGGILVSSNSKPSAFKTVIHTFDCHDYTRLLDRKLVPDTFKNKTVDEIIATLKDLYFPNEITINNVDSPVLIKSVAFNYLPISKVLTQLADTINYDWWIDYDKDLHFQSKVTTDAPFNISDGDGSYAYNSLVIRRDNSQLRNTVIVRGGEYLGAQLTWEQQTDGSANTYPTRYKFTDFEATLTGNALSIGLNGIHSPLDFDALHDFNQKILIFQELDKPAASKSLKMAGKPNLPVIIKYKAQEHITATRSAELGSGDYEYLIEDKSIKTKEGARQRAEAEVLAYAETLSEGEFVTETAGLIAGHRIFIGSASRGIGEHFVINKVTTTQRTKDKLRYHISLITTRTFDLIDILNRLLLESTKKIVISSDETIDLVEAFPAETLSISEIVVASKVVDSSHAESVNFGETFSATEDYEIEFVAGPFVASGTKRVFIINGSRLGPDPWLI